MSSLRRTLGITWICSVAATNTASLARAEHTVGNGGGYSEGQVLFATQSLKQAIAICRQATFCELDAAQEHALDKMLPFLDAIAADPNYITFKSEADAPDIFPPGERIAFKTAMQAGAPVLVNRTLLYLPTGTGFFTPISLTEAYALVTEIIAYQVSDLEPQAARDLGISLGVMMTMHSQQLELGLSTHPVRIADPDKRPRLLVLSPGGVGSSLHFSTVLLQDSERMVDITDDLSRQIRCDNDSQPSFELTQAAVLTMSLALSRLTVNLTGEVRYVCQADPQLIHAGYFQLKLSYAELLVENPAGPDDRAFRLIPAAIRLTIAGEDP